MDWIFFETKQQSFLSPSQQPYFLSDLSPPPPQVSNLQSGFSLNNKVSPSILLIIVILAIIFFVSGLLHLLVRFLLRPPVRDPDDLDNVTALQGQLQQLFHLHDAGVDQSFIDTLPIFNYKAIIGVKDPFDCAVCLCEFEGEDKLRLLPKCSHAFHMECIDTWLLSHSTCPLCRASLLPDFSPNNSCSPIVLVLESGSESSREIVSDRDGGGGLGSTNLSARANSHLGFHCEEDFGSTRFDISHKSCEIQVKDDPNQEKMVGAEEKVVPIKLGKFRNVDGGGGGGGGGEGSSTNNSVDARRCFSMGSFQYVMDENSSLQVPIRTPLKKQSSKKPNLPPLNPGHRTAISEYDCESRRDFNGFEPFKSVEIHGGSSISNGNDNGNGKSFGRSKRESFSVSKIWLRGNKNKANSTPVESSRRAFSFRFPVHRDIFAGDEWKAKNCGSDARKAKSEIGTDNWNYGGGSEFGCDEEIQSCNSLESQAKTPSFARRTLLWLVGRQNKVVHSSFSPNV
ncbi:RING-H2 finger protein ATL13-like [Cornus florida]|uniref:RING-H2 finger protein ATL13-like n=1 Tax=Cornus florida TaxID=4283 RepID=UPI00289F4C6A|nr:RING-H2 finger protein ATL13-like [Cornus florida]